MNKATEACPSTDCGEVDRGNDFNPKLMRLSNDAKSETMNKAREVPLIKRACTPTDCEVVDGHNDFNPKLIRLSNDADSNTVNKATEASLNDKACQTEDCGVVNGCINFNSKDPELIRRSIAQFLYSKNKATETSKNNRACPPESGAGKIYQFKIILHHLKPKIWRRVQVPGEYSFKQLHKVIQKAMDWNNSHLHQFTMKKTKTRDEEFIRVLLDPDYDDGEIRNERETKIAEHFLAPKDTAIYVYDLGSPWKHDIVLEKILPAVASITYPRCLAGRRKAPIEDPTESEEELFYSYPLDYKIDPKSINFS